MSAFMASFGDYMSTPLGLFVTLFMILYAGGFVLTMVLLWTAKAGSREERIAKAILAGGAFLAMPMAAFILWPNILLSGLFMLFFAIELALKLNPGRRAREREREILLANLDSSIAAFNAHKDAG